MTTDDGVAIAVTHYDAGSGRLILLAPGFWRVRGDRENVFVAVHLARLGYDVAAFDFRGHGASGGRYTFGREEWRDLLAVARGFPGHEGLAVVGFSMGASTADAIRAPDLSFRAPRHGFRPTDFARRRRALEARRPEDDGVGAPRAAALTDCRTRPSRPRRRPSRRSPSQAHRDAPDDWLVRPAHGRRLARVASPPVEHVHLSVRDRSTRMRSPAPSPLCARSLLKTRFPAPTP
jgi:pimeloyl-ACP methyl ester carboxylesterase